ncbi:hypothetical protein PoB_001495300 [Plakobranchus ocellatus]|uniref:Uncharacterized protein n=1 Tax=Plakobranchus ocellatus TaxID=259542 RepID=A0AAV3Z1R6_9GAST|nr:hypothetical protein PoB_001495300 [Plakobranchus ocellatus]
MGTDRLLRCKACGVFLRTDRDNHFLFPLGRTLLGYTKLFTRFPVTPWDSSALTDDARLSMHQNTLQTARGPISLMQPGGTFSNVIFFQWPLSGLSRRLAEMELKCKQKPAEFP